MKPFISIVMPTYNRGYIIDRAIKSVLEQDFEDFEIVVIDDNSKDNTKDVVISFGDKRISYYKNDINLGQIANMQKGVALAKGEWIIFLSDDDFFGNRRNLSMIYNLAKKEKLQAIFIEHKIYNGLFIIDNIPKDLPPVIDPKKYLKDYYWEVLNITIKKDLFLKLELYSGQSYFSEIEAQDLVCMSQDRVGYLKDFSLVFNIDDNNLNKFKVNIYDFIMSINYLKRAYFYAKEREIFSKEELYEIYTKRFEQYFLEIAPTPIALKYKKLLISINRFYIENIEDKNVDNYLISLAKTTRELYQDEIDQEIKEYIEYKQKLKQSLDKVKTSKKIIIYGTKSMAISLHRQIGDRVVAFLDDFYKKSEFLGKRVIRKEDLNEIDFDLVVLATTNYEYIKKMKDGLPEEKVVYLF